MGMAGHAGRKFCSKRGSCGHPYTFGELARFRAGGNVADSAAGVAAGMPAGGAERLAGSNELDAQDLGGEIRDMAGKLVRGDAAFQGRSTLYADDIVVWSTSVFLGEE